MGKEMPQSIKVINFNFVSYFCCNSFHKKGKRFFASTQIVINFIISIMLIVIHFSAKIKKKMLYSSSFDALKKCLVGIQKYIQVICYSITAHSLQSKDYLFNRYQGNCLWNLSHHHLQATDESEASRDEVEKQLRATDRQ